MANETGTALVDGALAVLLDRAGGEVRYTQAEHLAITARRGDYRIVAEIDRSQNEPAIVVRIIPVSGSSGPVM
jgi:hypothetical protein